MKKLVMIPLVALFAHGCMPGQQDPMKDKMDKLREGIPARNPNKKPEPMRSDTVKIDSMDSWSFQEGRTDQYDLGARVLYADYDVELRVTNLADFPDAVYDPQIKKLQWTPPRGISGAEVRREMLLKVQAIASHKKEEGAVSYINTRVIRVFVQKEIVSPEVISVGGIPDGVREFTSSNFTIEVRDPNASPAKRLYPSIDILPPMGGLLNLSPFVSMESVQLKAGTPDQYVFRMKISADTELTSSRVRGGFRFLTKSPFGMISAVQEVKLDVMTSLTPAVGTWKGSMSFIPGADKSYQFLIHDPKFEGNISITRTEGLPADATVDYQKTAAHSVLVTVSWNPAARDANKTGEIKIFSENRNTNASDAAVIKQTITVPYKVSQAPQRPVIGGEQ